MGGECPRREGNCEESTHGGIAREGACSDSRACAYRWRTGVCPVREAQGAARAHAPTWASIRAAHATLSLSFVTRIGAHTAGR